MSGNVLDCRVRYDGDEGGHTETKNGQIRQHKTTAKVAAACEMSTRIGATARLFKRAGAAGEDVNRLGYFNA